MIYVAWLLGDLIYLLMICYDIILLRCFEKLFMHVLELIEEVSLYDFILCVIYRFKGLGCYTSRPLKDPFIQLH